MKLDYTTFAPVTGNMLSGRFPDNAEIGVILRRLTAQFPGKLRYFEAGQSVEGRPVHAAVLSDFSAPPEAKSHVVFSGAEHGTEKNAATTILALIERLLTGGEEEAEILRAQELTLIPVVNPDGYDTVAFTNRNGVNLFADYRFDCGPSQPESRALAAVLENSMPELFVSVHGHAHDETKIRLTESTGIAFTTRTSRCHSHELVEAVNRAAESAGYPQDRGEEDSQRILAALNQAPEHSFEAFDREECTSATWAYHRFHALAMSMEVVYLKSGVLRLMEFLRGGMRCWAGEAQIGYPAWVISRWNHLFLTPAGDNTAIRRQNRIHLWRNNIQITLFANTPGYAGTFFGGVAFGYAAMRQLHELSEKPYRLAPSLDVLLDFLTPETGTRQQFAAATEMLFHEAEAAYFIEPCARQNINAPSAAPPAAVRLLYRLPVDAEIAECRAGGRPNPPYRLFSQGLYRYLSVEIPMRPEWAIGSLYIEYRRKKCLNERN